MAQTKAPKLTAPMTYYKKLRLHNLCSNKYRHLLLLIFWPVFGILFAYVEKHYPVVHYTPVYSIIDGFIPFFEWFVIPYLFWFIYLAGMVLYTLLYDISAYKKMMLFIIITYTLTIVIYLIWPTCQELRPSSFERDNLFTRIMSDYYAYDTNTNVCPSLHVIGAVAVQFAFLHLQGRKHIGWHIAFILTTVLICLSTVFLKQHSIIDVFAALPVCLLGYFLSFPCYKKKTTEKADQH